MKILYTLYAVAIVLLSWNLEGDTQVKEAVVKGDLALWCVALPAILANWRRAEYLALTAFLPVIGLLTFQMASRIAFVIEHGGMDCPHCDASPMAFLLGAALEAVFLVIGVALCIWLVRRVRRRLVAS